ncbi:MAG TPA: PilT/PilU family type 4a pilus ATPase [Syntrophorhabdaceae bacterium]|nr:PilT/PilU family type 4a pilus ATPase [Syntrophorhabdaceae bacterium]HPC67247.1 PilT/PilU family type 4a pilus ATPase [Syntrophorhabdaceae bacterium]HQE80417.1 PilT/PilU family type 4a pilus ATPase [Syntrophorhabdaceae bacterium]
MKIEILQRVLKDAVARGAHSIFFFPGLPPLGNKKGLERLGLKELNRGDIDDILGMTLTEWERDELERKREIDYSFETKTGIRFRMAAFYRMGQAGIVARPVPSDVPSFDTLGLPSTIKDFTNLKDGIVFITGPTGSGKSTTLASLIDIINQNKGYHIVTVEDPIEFVYKNKRSIISQREIGRDTKSYTEALRRILREDPDIILIGEIRDRESMTSALELAETGHLVFSTLHTINVVQTINRILDFFPEHEKQQVRKQVSQVLQGVVCQRLIKKKEGNGFVCACEVLKINQSVRNLIKDDKVHQITTIMDSMKKEGSISMDDTLIRLYREGIIGYHDLLAAITDTKKIKEIDIEHSSEAIEQHVYGTGIAEIDRRNIIYRADYESINLSYFDASGIIAETPQGILFRDTGHSKGESHFIGDYTILNGKKQQFTLRHFFNFSYIIKEVRIKKPVYRFQVKIVENAKKSFDIPKYPYELVFDDKWRHVAIPIPKIYEGSTVRYYLMFFDRDIKAIEFNSIYFS